MENYRLRLTELETENVSFHEVNSKTLNKFLKTTAKKSTIESKIGSGMPTSMHNRLAKHNNDVRKQC